jgi:hypothetical protein
MDPNRGEGTAVVDLVAVDAASQYVDMEQFGVAVVPASALAELGLLGGAGHRAESSHYFLLSLNWLSEGD